MPGSKRKKFKSMLSPHSTPKDDTPILDVAHDEVDPLDDLLAEMDKRDETTSLPNVASAQTGKSPSKTSISEQISARLHGSKGSKSRFKEREARKAAARAQAQPPDDPVFDERMQAEAKAEEETIASLCKDRGLNIHEINPDGHCLFSAVADQLHVLGIVPPSEATYQKTRSAAADFMLAHPDDFMPFLPSVAGEDGPGATDINTGIISPGQFRLYCNTIRNTGAWGGEPEIQAMSKAYGVDVHVIQWGKPPVVVHEASHSSSHPTPRVVHISYHRRMYGLGEHYNSLRPVVTR